MDRSEPTLSSSILRTSTMFSKSLLLREVRLAAETETWWDATHRPRPWMSLAHHSHDLQVFQKDFMIKEY